MGDHRASIKIEFSAHGHKKTADFWINYWPPERDSVDERITEWFKEQWNLALDRYETVIDEGIKEQAEKEKAIRREQYQKLKAEFDVNPPAEGKE